MKPKISIIILNWNGWEDTLECLESINRINYPNYDILVVDNGSEDESISKIHEYAEGLSLYNHDHRELTLFEYIKYDDDLDDDYFKLNSNQRLVLIKNDNNIGFSAGNNIGIKFSLKNLKSEYVLLLNNDTVVQENFLDELVDFAEKEPEIGIVGPGVYFYDKPEELAYIGHNINLCNARISDPPALNTEPKQLDYVVGCGLLIKRVVIEKVGLLDTDYFLYYEDADWCLRAKKIGYKVFYVPRSKIYHKISCKKRSVTSYYYGNRNSFLIVKKNRDFKGICYLKMFINKMMLSLYLIVTGSRKEGFAVIKAVYDGISGHYGPKLL